MQIVCAFASLPSILFFLHNDDADGDCDDLLFLHLRPSFKTCLNLKLSPLFWKLELDTRAATTKNYFKTLILITPKK